MARRPEIGNVKLYPDRPLNRNDRNGYVLKFYCPIRDKRIRRNCGTRDRREARRILRECRERLLNGEYVASDGAITAEQAMATQPSGLSKLSTETDSGPSWEECYQRYRDHRSVRIRGSSLTHALSRVNLAERVLGKYAEDHGLHEHLLVREVMTLDALEFLQEQLLDGAESRRHSRSPNTVNSMMGAVMAFVRFCQVREWIDRVPPLQKLDSVNQMKGRPVTQEEFQQMLDATESVVGSFAADSWAFLLRVLWESGFRVGDVMDFHWTDSRHIHPVWSVRQGEHSTVAIPSSQKNRQVQLIPLLPGLEELLQTVPRESHVSWVVNPIPVRIGHRVDSGWFKPLPEDLIALARSFTNCAIGDACMVTETAVRKWLDSATIQRESQGAMNTSVPAETVQRMRVRAVEQFRSKPDFQRLTVEHVSRVVSKIGTAAGVVVQEDDSRTGQRLKYASAHDLRRGCAQRLINAGISAETLKVVMRHADFATTEKHYSARRGAQSAASELLQKLSADRSSELVGGLMGGHEKTPQLDAEELLKLKALLAEL